jgi:hypothetical protein
MNRPDFLFRWLLPVTLLFSIIFSSDVCADGIDFRGQFFYRTTDSETTNKRTGRTLTSEFWSFDQQYRFDFSKTLYPYLTLIGGTLYQLNTSTSTAQDIEFETEEKVLKPYVEFNLRSPLYEAGLGYRRTQIENKASVVPDTQDVRDVINSNFGWNPAGFPELNLNYWHTHTYNDTETIDTVEKLFAGDTKYTIGQNLHLRYFYTRDAKEDTLSGSETLDQAHNGRIDYSRSFFNRRLSLSTNYRIRYSTFEFETTGEVNSPLLRSAGLSSIDDTPEDGPALNLNPALIDGNLTASAGLNIGLNGDDTTLVNIGLDFGFPVDVDKIRIYVDRNLSASVINYFSWSIYTSPDNLDTSTWTFQETVSPAIFGTFENYFEISFSVVNTRYIKVVTRPLSPTVPDAAVFPNIFVTEMEAFSTQLGTGDKKEIINADHNYNLNLTGKLGDKMILGYNLYYRLREQDQDPFSTEKTELSNGINFNYLFNRVFSARASISRIDRTEDDLEIFENNYSASLKAVYFETFDQILTFSGTKTEEGERSSSTNTLFLRTNAELYRGWSAFLDLGYSSIQDLENAEGANTIIRFGTNLVPNEKITANINYQLTSSERTDGGNGHTFRSQWDIQAFYTPFRALSVNARVNIDEREDFRSTLYEFDLNWSPFSDGALQFFFTFTERLRPELEEDRRAIGPGLKWTLGRYLFMDMTYTITEDENSLETTESDNLIVNLRITF